jgi:transcription elongation factor GreA
MTDDRIPMTRDGYDKLKVELDRLRGYEMIEITKRVATAREMGDLSENAEYHAARETRACSRPASATCPTGCPGRSSWT